MNKMILALAIAFPTLTSAAVVREIDGKKYNIHDDFDTADGECVLRGHKYAIGFYSYGAGGTLPVLVLRPDGAVKSILDNSNGQYSVIQGIDCE